MNVSCKRGNYDPQREVVPKEEKKKMNGEASPNLMLTSTSILGYAGAHS